MPSSNAGTPTSVATTILQPNADANLSTVSQGETVVAEVTPNDEPVAGQVMLTPQVIKGLISFLSQESTQPLWNYEDITAKGKCNRLVLTEHERNLSKIEFYSQFGRLSRPSN